MVSHLCEAIHVNDDQNDAKRTYASTGLTARTCDRSSGLMDGDVNTLRVVGHPDIARNTPNHNGTLPD